MPVVLYGYETWLLTLREECSPRVSENRVLRRIYRPKRDEVTREWKKLHNEELNDLYSLLSIVAGQVKKNEKGRTCSMYGEMRGVYSVLVGKPEGRIPLGRPRYRWEENIKMDLQGVGWGSWTGLIWLRTGTGGRHL